KGIERIECADRGVTHRPAARRVRVDIIEILEVRPVFQVTVQRHAVRCRSLRCSGDEKREDEPGEYYGRPAHHLPPKRVFQPSIRGSAAEGARRSPATRMWPSEARSRAAPRQSVA